MTPRTAAPLPATVTISPLRGAATERVRLLAGTGALWTWVPTEVLRRLGIRPAGIRRFRSLGGEVVERPYAEARIGCLGQDGPSLVVFASRGDQNTLGDHALLTMGVEIDPEGRSLRLMYAIPAYALAT